jgi:hypothetical protein
MKEMEASIWLSEPQDLLPVLGPLGTQIFTQQIQTGDFDAVVRDFSYRVVAGSARKPNKSNRVRELTEFGRAVAPTLQAMVMQGIVDPWNAYVSDMADALDLDPEKYLIRLPEPEEKGPSEDEVDMKLKEEEHDQSMGHKEEEHDLDMDIIRDRGFLDIDIARRKASASSSGNGRYN